MFSKNKLMLVGAAALALSAGGCGKTIQERQAEYDPLCTTEFSEYENSQRVWAFSGLTIQSEATGNFRKARPADIAQAALASQCTDAAMEGAAEFAPDYAVQGTIGEELMDRGRAIESAQVLMRSNPTYYTRGLPVTEVAREN